MTNLVGGIKRLLSVQADDNRLFSKDPEHTQPFHEAMSCSTDSWQVIVQRLTLQCVDHMPVTAWGIISGTLLKRWLDLHTDCSCSHSCYLFLLIVLIVPFNWGTSCSGHSSQNFWFNFWQFFTVVNTQTAKIRHNLHNLHFMYQSLDPIWHYFILPYLH